MRCDAGQHQLCALLSLHEGLSSVCVSTWKHSMNMPFNGPDIPRLYTSTISVRAGGGRSTGKIPQTSTGSGEHDHVPWGYSVRGGMYSHPGGESSVVAPVDDRRAVSTSALAMLPLYSAPRRRLFFYRFWLFFLKSDERYRRSHH